MAWSIDDIPDLTGRTAVVTGPTGGLGLVSAGVLAAKGAGVVVAGRHLDTAGVVRSEILLDHPEALIETRRLDLGSLDSIGAFAEAVTGDHPSIDLLINNAGVMGTPRLETADGFELQFGTNHLGHFALTALMMPAILRAGRGRVVTVTSYARHFRVAVDPDDLGMEGGYDTWLAYGRSKMCNHQFALELQHRLAAAGSATASLSAHPGMSHTNLQAASVAASGGGRSQRFFHLWARTLGTSAAAGALPQLRAATDPGLPGGSLVAPRWVVAGAPVRRPTLRRFTRERSMLWEVSERATGIPFDVAGMVERAAG
ncbi:MAG: SDR family NAD(P)-dependent oxidoreductase [Actinobacteria bacterium]|nr:SDR family NAD(P)-dependent oxidoreductase [Actinomycetota bacterium]